MIVPGLVAGITAGTVTQSALAADIDVVNNTGTISNQILSSNGGLSSTGFTTASNNGVSLWLRVRDKGPGTAVLSSNTFTLEQNPTIQFEFQFTPQAGDTLPGGGQFNNYQFMIQWDDDPTAGVNYATSPKYIVFDDDDNDTQYVKSPNGDIDDRDDDPNNGPNTDSPYEPGDDQEELFLDASWDDGDSLIIDGVTVRGGNTVDFISNGFVGTLPEWVVVNSWRPQWVPGGGFTSPTDPGLYNVQLTVFDETGATTLASLESTVHIVPEPTSLALLALGGLTMIRRCRDR